MTSIWPLAGVFEAFRDLMFDQYELDPSHYVTAPGISCDTMLKMTEAEFELISDQEMYDFVERAKHGGVSTIITRYAKASKPYIGNIRGKTPKKIMTELRKRTNTVQQFSIEDVCEYFSDFSQKEIKALRKKMEN